jgi:hypothetical protein
MYLLVFVFLMISIIGLYTELYALQVSKMMAREKALGQAMLVWHGGVTAFARTHKGTDPNELGSDSVTAQGCLLTSNPAAALAYQLNSCGSLMEYNDSALPTGYNADYKWYSIAYVPLGGTQQYVMTFAPPSEAGNLTSPMTLPAIGYSPAEILMQLKNSGAPRTAYGMARDYGMGLVKFDTPDSPAVPMPSYIVPKSGMTMNYVPAGSVGLISPF